MKRWLPLAFFVALACDDGGDIAFSGGQLELDPPPGTELVFGEATIGLPAPRPIVIVAKNVGRGFLSLGEPRIEGPGAAAFSVPIWPRTIDPGRSHEIFVELDAAAPRSADAVLVITSNDRDRREVRYPIGGRVREPCRLAADPEWLTFDVGETKDARLVAHGTSPCTINRISLDERLFEIVDRPQVPLTIPAGGTLIIPVRHTHKTAVPGRPIRELWALEAEGGAAVVRLEGAAPVAGCAEVYPPKIRFAPGARGRPARGRAIIANHCDDASFEVLSAAVSGARAYTAEPAAVPIVVPPLGQVSVWVEHRPQSEAGDFGQLHLRTSDVHLRRVAVELEGTALVPRLVTIPRIDLGSAPYREPFGPDLRSTCHVRPRLVPLYNAGSGALLVSSIELEVTDGHFELVGVYLGSALLDARAPFEIPPFEVAHALVELTPTRAGAPDHRATLVVRHEDAAETRVDLVGRGALDSRVVDEHVAETPPIDLLFVVDDSASMQLIQRRLAAATPRLAAELGTLGRVSVTQTEGRWPLGGFPERCVPHPVMLSTGAPDAAHALACMLSVGLRGSEPAAGLGAAMRFFERALRPPLVDGAINPNAGFLRDDARLAVVIASDEEDQSFEPVAMIADFLRALKGYDRSDLVSFHAIAGGAGASCRDTSPWVQDARRYQDAAAAVGGTFHDVCALDYAPHFDAISRRLTSTAERTYLLTQAADPSTVVVSVDGASVPEDAVDGFTFHARSNTVRLSGATAPAAGQGVTISYAPDCRPPFRDPR